MEAMVSPSMLIDRPPIRQGRDPAAPSSSAGGVPGARLRATRGNVRGWSDRRRHRARARHSPRCPSRTSPNRFFLAKQSLSALMSRLAGDRFSLVAFEGEAYPLVPLTLDADAVALFLETLEPGFVPLPGSNLLSGIEAGIATFVDPGRVNRVIVLVSDGEDLEESLEGGRGSREGRGHHPHRGVDRRRRAGCAHGFERRAEWLQAPERRARHFTPEYRDPDPAGAVDRGNSPRCPTTRPLADRLRHWAMETNRPRASSPSARRNDSRSARAVSRLLPPGLLWPCAPRAPSRTGLSASCSSPSFSSQP
jgi:hypothetical protein